MKGCLPHLLHSGRRRVEPGSKADALSLGFAASSSASRYPNCRPIQGNVSPACTTARQFFSATVPDVGEMTHPFQLDCVLPHNRSLNLSQVF